MKLKSYKHYPLSKSKKESNKGIKKLYRVTTINWTFANQTKGKTIDYNTVHKNIYIGSLESLIKFIREIEEVAEDIIDITKESK